MSAPAQRIQLLAAAADIALLTAFLQGEEPTVPHYAAAMKSLHIYGLEETQIEAAAYAKVLALANRQDVHTCITAIIEHVPDLQRARPGRPGPGKAAQSTAQTTKKHLDLASMLVEQVEERSEAGNFTNAVNQALVLWLLFHDEHIPPLE